MDILAQKLLQILSVVCRDKEIEAEKLSNIEWSLHLRNELQLDSLDLAEFGVRIENEFGMDIFESGPVNTLAEVRDKIEQSIKPSTTNNHPQHV